MNCSPTISVILPAYNAERFLREAIDSILKQTFCDFELIVLNDGSTDRTEEIILSYTDPRIRYIKNDTNLKLIKTLNKGIDLARGKYIARMDADDISLPNRFEKEVAYLEGRPDVAVVSCFPYNMNMEGKLLGKSSYFCVTRPLPCKFVSMFEPSICHPICMFRADAIKSYKYNDSEEYLHIEAYELWNRMFHTGAKGGMIPEFLLYYRDNTSSVCHVHNEAMFDHHLNVLKRSLKDYLGIETERGVGLCIMSRSETENLRNIDEAFQLLDRCKDAFITKEQHIESSDISEIKGWISQRKLAILLTSLLSSHGEYRLKIFLKFICNCNLLFKKQNIKYIKNRITRMVNER